MFSEKYLHCGAFTQTFHICSLQDLQSGANSIFQLRPEAIHPALLFVHLPHGGGAPQAVPRACQDPDVKLGKALAATSGCAVRSKGIASRSGLHS